MFTCSGKKLEKTERDGYIGIFVGKPCITHGRRTWRMRVHNPASVFAGNDFDIGLASETYPFDMCWLRCSGAACISQDKFKSGDEITVHVDIDKGIAEFFVNNEHVHSVNNIRDAVYPAVAMRAVGAYALLL